MSSLIDTSAIQDSSITQDKLNTTYGEVGGVGNRQYTLPGGEYGFEPVVKGEISQITKSGLRSLGATYTNTISIAPYSGSVYAKQRYVQT